MPSKIDLPDILAIIGISLAGTGLYIRYGMDIMLIVIGGVISLLGITAVMLKGR